MDNSGIARVRELLHPNDTYSNIHKRVGSKIHGKKIEIGKGQAVDEFLKSTFEDCEIRIYSGGRCTGNTLHDCQFENCLIWASKKQIIPTWESSFKNCAFKGKYEARFPGPVLNCDFSKAVLNIANFQQEGTLGDTIFPNYPHVIISNAMSNYEDWKETPKPKEFNRFIVHPRTKGNTVVINLSDAVNDPDAFWEAIKNKSYVSSYLKSYNKAKSLLAGKTRQPGLATRCFARPCLRRYV